MSKLRVAFFDFACCEGCQLQLANTGEDLLNILGRIDVVTFREIMSEKSDEYDIAVVEGSITTDHAESRIKEIRQKAEILIAYGSCATIGGVNGMKNEFELDEVKSYVYAEYASCYDSQPTKAIDQVVAVDYYVHGCPVYIPEFVKVLKSALLQIPYNVPNTAVCTECKLNENVCMYEKGVTCLGPVTRSGCNSWCINNGNICYGCRGRVSNPALNAQKQVLDKYGVSISNIYKKMTMYTKAVDDE